FARTRPGCVRAAARSVAPAIVLTSATVVHARQPEQARNGAGEGREEQDVEPVERGHRSVLASKCIVSAPARSIRPRDVIARPAPGLSTPSADLIAGGIAAPSTDVPQLLASWMKNSPVRSRRRRKCSRDTFGDANTCTSTHTELPPRPTDSVSLHLLKF